MSLLIQLKDRLKGIQTIKKLTHAMRLISMSSRSQLKNKEEPLILYKQVLSDLFNQVKSIETGWKNPYLHPSNITNGNSLIILIGSARGLCGNFNTILFRFFESKIGTQSDQSGIIQIIPVGKKAINYAKAHSNFNIITQYPDLHAKTIHTIAVDITNRLQKTPNPFTHVYVFSNKLKTFFVQKPQMATVIPFQDIEQAHVTKSAEYIWEQPPTLLLDALAQQLLQLSIEQLLFQSLLAEHAARFITMDNATRNAQRLLEETQLQYNKLRQSKITKELTELITSL